MAKLKRTFLAALGVCAMTAWCAPTEDELAASVPEVKARLQLESQRYAAGKLSREQVGDSAMREARAAETDAERALMYKGAFVFYVKARAYGKAAEAFSRWRSIMAATERRRVDELMTQAEAGLSEDERTALKDEIDGTWWCRRIPDGVYWNVTLENGAVTLLAHENEGRLCVQPLS